MATKLNATEKDALDNIKASIRQEFESGVATFKQLSGKYDIKEGTIKSWASREGWKKGKAGKEEKSKSKAASQDNKQPQLKKKEIVATAAFSDKSEKGKKKDRVATKNDKQKKIATKKRDAKNQDKKRDNVGSTEIIERLTEKEELFCFNFVNVHQFNATRSYLAAYGCSYDSARFHSSTLLTKSNIRAEINRLKEIKYQQIMINANDLVEKHMRIAFANITDFVEFGQVEVPVMGPFGPVVMKHKVVNARGEEEERPFPVTKIVNDLRFKESWEVDGSLIKSIKAGKESSIELHDPQKSMEWLERWFTWNPMDRHKVEFDRRRLEFQEKELEIKSNLNGANNQESITDHASKVQEAWKNRNANNGGVVADAS